MAEMIDCSRTDLRLSRKCGGRRPDYGRLHNGGIVRFPRSQKGILGCLPRGSWRDIDNHPAIRPSLHFVINDLEVDQYFWFNDHSAQGDSFLYSLSFLDASLLVWAAKTSLFSSNCWISSPKFAIFLFKWLFFSLFHFRQQFWALASWFWWNLHWKACLRWEILHQHRVPLRILRGRWFLREGVSIRLVLLLWIDFLSLISSHPWLHSIPEQNRRVWIRWDSLPRVPFELQ